MAIMNRKLNLVVLDDDPAVLRLVETFLKAEFKEDVHVFALSDPYDLQVFIEERGCDILLSDIEMPGLDGMEVLKIAKKRNVWTQVIFMTGCSTWDRISFAIENGATDYLTKPIKREELIRTVRYQQERITRWRRAAMESMRLKKERTAEPAGS